MKEWSELPPGHVVFCDDIREEVGGKFSLIGIYKGSINVHSKFPTIMAKLGISVSLRWPNPSFMEDTRIAVFLPDSAPDAPVASVEIKQSEIVSGPDEFAENAFVEMSANLILSPVAINGEGSIRVRAFNSHGEIKLGSIKVISALSDTA